MRPAPGEVLHFVPHVAAIAREPDPYVWAVDAEQAPSSWFPRHCPRALAWVGPRTTMDDRDRVLGPGGGLRAHAIEYGGVERFHTARLWAYRLPAAGRTRCPAVTDRISLTWLAGNSGRK